MMRRRGGDERMIVMGRRGIKKEEAMKIWGWDGIYSVGLECYNHRDLENQQ